MSKYKLLTGEPIVSETGHWMAKLRAALFDAVKESDIAEIASALVKRAKEGDLQATRLLFSYVLGSGGVKIQNATVVLPNGMPAPSFDADEPPVRPALTHRKEKAVENIGTLARRVREKNGVQD